MNRTIHFSLVGREDSLGLELLLPVRLQVDGLPVGSGCWRVNMAADGHLMCETFKGIEVKNKEGLNTIRTLKDTKTATWGEIIQPKDVMVASCYKQKEKVIEVVLLDPSTLQKSRSLYSRPVKSFVVYRIAQHGSLVYIVDNTAKQLVVCSLVDGKIKNS